MKNRNISSKIKRSKVTDYAALNLFVLMLSCKVLRKHIFAVWNHALVTFLDCILKSWLELNDACSTYLDQLIGVFVVHCQKEYAFKISRYESGHVISNNMVF